MNISIKFKFSAFLALLLLFTVFLLSLFVLRGLKANQQNAYEDYLQAQAQTANTYFLQSLLSAENKVPQHFLETHGERFVKDLELITGQVLSLYDQKGSLVSPKLEHMKSDAINNSLEMALTGRTAYVSEGEALYYFTPLKIGKDQVGVLQFYYSLTEASAFYKRMRQLFITVGAAVFLGSFFLAYLYFANFAGAIMQLERSVSKVRDGQYASAVLKRRDELGRLSTGIQAMSETIESNIQGLEQEREKLDLAVQRLSALEKKQKQFIGNVSHEFKTPLTSIKAYLDLLSMYPDDAELFEKAKEAIAGESERLNDMVEKVLQLSALESYGFTFNKEVFELEPLLRTALNSLQAKMAHQHLRLESELQAVRLEADRDSVLHIVMNVLENAIKYNRPDGHISIKTRQEGDQGIIEVADSGVGIAPALQERIFEPFFTAEKDRSRQSGGVGLGLALARQQAEAQGGTLELVHSDAQGSLFRITFPAA